MLGTWFRGVVASAFVVLFAGCAGSTPPALNPDAPVAQAGARSWPSSKMAAGKQGGWMFVSNLSPAHLQTILEFPKTDSGNVASARRFSTAGSLLAVDASGNSWLLPSGGGPTYALLNFDALGLRRGKISGLSGLASAAIDPERNVYTLEAGLEAFGPDDCEFENPVVKKYAAGSYGKDLLSRFIPSNLPIPIACTSQIAVDEMGNTYIATNAMVAGVWEAASIQEYAPAVASSPERRIRTIYFPGSTGTTMLDGVAGDRSGNLYALVNDSLVEYPAGSKRPVQVLPSYSVTSFALDSKADIYAIVKSASGKFSIDVFKAGKSTPFRVVAGARPSLSNPTAIVVSP